MHMYEIEMKIRSDNPSEIIKNAGYKTTLTKEQYEHIIFYLAKEALNEKES